MYNETDIKEYGMKSSQSKGRLFSDSSRADVRSPFARDRDRILHSEAFRRLKGKTQVFMSTDEDHHRTRLTHTLEVAQIARTLARALFVNEDLTETVALAHDLGHPPYGHIGEDALSECMEEVRGFEHNEQSLRIVSKLEERYTNFDGLNLTWESLEGILKHNGPITGTVPYYIEKFNKQFDLEISTHATLEAQIAAIADDVAYNHHDIEDGIRSGLISLNDLYEIKHIGDVLDMVKADNPNATEKTILAETLRRLMSAMVMDIVATTNKNIEAINPQSSEDIRNCGRQVVKMSDDMFNKTKQVKTFLSVNLYRCDVMNVKREECKVKVKTLFNYYMDKYEDLPEIFDTVKTFENETEKRRHQIRRVADYVAGMTDNFADKEYERLK
ncbi:MAG: deoxyguanosinetriphosphate triphosphohydrolase [Alphaproteobacteria bacterium]